MKSLAILRHAKSSWDEPGLADFNRPLNERGWKAARRVGRELKDRHIGFDLCVASTAARVRETLDGLIESYGNPDFEIRFEPRIYEATSATLLEIVRSLPDSASAVLMVGHNPGLEQFVARLSADDCKGLRNRVLGKFPPAAFVRIEFGTAHWSEIEPAAGEIVDLILPKDLD